MLNTDDVCSSWHLEWGSGEADVYKRNTKPKQGETVPPGARTCGLCLEQGGGGTERKPKTNWV